MRARLAWPIAVAGLAGVALAAVPERHAASLSAVAQVGEAMFFDPALSASGRQSCASCHDPAHAFAPADARSVELGGPDMASAGIRAVPSLSYAALTPAFSIGPEPAGEEGGGAAIPAAATPAKASATPLTPRGGYFWDGRADTLQEQTLGPLHAGFEMANGTGALLARLRAPPYADRFRQLFGDGVLADPGRLLAEAQFALARFELEDPRFRLFSSKYDAWLHGTAMLTPAEERGRRLFDDPAKGNCAACHVDRPSRDGSPPLFTDFEYEALAVPRNSAIPANADPAWHDLGLCGPLRDDAVAHDPAHCGLFKTPSLRNVATRHAFFHNGVYHRLEDALRFYALRESDPGAVYPRGPDGKVRRYDDLPPAYWRNIDRTDAPFDRKPGDPPALTAAEIADLAAFLGTLTDGYR